MVSYPYQRLALSCGCHEVVTGPGCIDVFTCQEHAGCEDGGPLLDARLDSFDFAAKRIAAAEREGCAGILAEFLSKWANDMDEEEADDIRELLAAIRARV